MVDEYGEGIYPDFLFYYGVDLVDLYRPASGLTPRAALALLARLPAESKTVALMEGADDWRTYVGRDAHWYALADLYDAVNQNTRATGNWKRKAPKIAPYPRPGDTVNKITPLQFFGGFGKF